MFVRDQEKKSKLGPEIEMLEEVFGTWSIVILVTWIWGRRGFRTWNEEGDGGGGASKCPRRSERKGSVGHGFLLFKLSAMARALRSSSLFSRILKSSSAKPPCVAAASKRAFASSTHEHDDAGKSSSGFSHCFSNQLYLLTFSRTYVHTHTSPPYLIFLDCNLEVFANYSFCSQAHVNSRKETKKRYMISETLISETDSYVNFLRSLARADLKAVLGATQYSHCHSLWKWGSDPLW